MHFLANSLFFDQDQDDIYHCLYLHHALKNMESLFGDINDQSTDLKKKMSTKRKKR